MIILFLGNPGSGKTACAVREMARMASGRKIYSNILTKNLKHCVPIDAEMIVQKEMVGTKTKRSGETEAVYELKLNQEFWQEIKEPIDVVLDECHSIINARRAMSKVNQIVTDWMSLIRRVLGQSDSGYGRLILISQLIKRIDVIARDMATQIRYFRCHYCKTCQKCSTSWFEHSDNPEPMFSCPRCGSFKIKKHSHRIEAWHFANATAFTGWQEFGMNTYHRHYYINDIEDYFGYYDTLQWDNMFSELY